jgi:DNA-binding NtrC family response regulator
MSMKRILAYGEDAHVISTRAMILQRAGYDVAHTTRADELVSLLHGIFFDMLLIGDSLRTPQNVRLVQGLREQFPALPIVMVQDEKDERDPWSTAFVSSAPEQIVTAVRLFLAGNRKPVRSNTSEIKPKVMQSAAGH